MSCWPRWLSVLVACSIAGAPGALASAEGDAFLCYKSKPTPGSARLPRGTQATVTDPLHSILYDVRPPVALCAPASVNGTPPGDASTHLTAYPIERAKKPRQPAFERHVDIAVTTALGEVRVDAVKPNRLLVPAAVGTSGPVGAPAPGSHQVDHYACYKTKVTAGTPKPAPVRGVAVHDPIGGGPRLFDLEKVVRLCLAADKNGEGIERPGTGLLCYKARRSKGQPRHERARGLFLADQFGPAQADTVKEAELCLPFAGDVAPVNEAPDVDAGPDLTITLPSSAALAGTATDDGLPGPLTTTWTVVDGPGPVTFDDASAPATTATFVEAGTYVLRLTADDGELTSSDEVTVTVNPADTGGGLPPDPATVAPPLNPTVASSFADATSFLYTGPDPIQTGVAPGTIDPRRAAVLRGRVLDQTGAPLPGVAIGILHHPEFGQTLSRADGWFDLAVTGGGPLVVTYQRVGFLPAQRPVQAAWQDYALLPDVVLTALDPQATAIDLSAPVPMQVARGSAVTDADGTRQATLLFPQGTQASLVLPDGRQQPLTTLTVRATEYTVGDAGPLAMPGPLPPTSRYTYAVELSADEAIAAGAVRVQFSQPVILHVENFIGFPVGGIVPAGYYDRRRGAWIPSDNGRVIAILAVAGGLAELDVDGDGVADTGAALAALGITDAERERLAALYAPGQTLWRVPIPHFTPWDCNWPYGPPDDAERPDQPQPQPDQPIPNPSCQDGCVIEVESQILGERIALAGTPFSLNYRSDRAPGRLAHQGIALTGDVLPPSLVRVELEVIIAGRRIRHTFTPAPNLRHQFVWDGLDAYGRPVPGAWPVVVRIGYTYGAVRYTEPAAFGRAFARVSATGVRFSGDRGRNEITIWQEFGVLSTTKMRLGQFSIRDLALGGWSLDVHHAYDPGAQVLYLGNGGRVSALADRAAVIETVAGNGLQQFSGDGGPALEAGMDAGPVVADPDGTLYMADSANHRIRQITPDGIIATLVGTGIAGFSDGGSGGIRVNAPQALALGPGGVEEIPFVGDDGQPGIRLEPRPFLYFADTGNHRIRAIRRFSGQVLTQTIAGNGLAGSTGDEGPATAARLNQPTGLAVGPDGSLYVVETGGHRIRQILPDGTITTLAGTGVPGFSGDGGPARLAQLNAPYHGIAVGADGSVYFTDTGNHRVRRVAPDGTITTVAGTGVAGFNGDGRLASTATLSSPGGLDLLPSGHLLIVDTGNHRLRIVGRGGLIETLAGTGQRGFAGDRGPAAAAQLNFPASVRAVPDGSLLLTDHGNFRIRAIRSALPLFDGADLLIAHPDGTQLLRFDPDGRHLATVSTLTGSLLYTFGYDAAGRLTSVTDGDGNVTTIERAATGEPIAVVGPFGQRTTLTVDAAGYLSSVTNPAGETVGLVHTADGLLVQTTDPNGHTTTFAYDSLGRLVREQDAAGGSLDLTRTEDAEGYEVAVQTALGRITRYRIETREDGGRRQVNTSPAGISTESIRGADGGFRRLDADGSTITALHGPDPRFGMHAPVLTSLTAETGGRRSELTASQTAVLQNPLDPLSLVTLTDSVTLNGRTATSVYTASTRTTVATTPAGRTTTTVRDARGRPTRVEIPGLHPIELAYDARGRLASMVMGTRSVNFAYGSDGWLERMTGPDGDWTFARDAAGRPIRATSPGGEVTELGWDARGNLVSLTPPGRPAHAITYTPFGRLAAHTPPAVAGTGSLATTHTYNLDRRLTRIDRPDGTRVDLAHDAAGRLDTVTIARGTVDLDYSPTTGKLTRITAPGGETLTYSYTGALLTGIAVSGTANGSIQATYDDDFAITRLTVNGATPIDFAYDADRLLVQAGALALTRDPDNGLVTGLTLGSLSTAIDHDAFGHVAGIAASHAGTELYRVVYARDGRGRVSRKTETVAGVAEVLDYAYDPSGRLAEVRRNGVLAAAYTYDANGNRLSRTAGAATEIGVHDDQDRLLQYGGATYVHGAAGEWQRKTENGQTTRYQYDELGNLVGVDLPGGARIDYAIDGRNRRVGKAITGGPSRRWLYQDALRPIAELDAAGNVVSRFVYATGANVPDYMIRGGATYLLVTDALGSVRLVVDSQTGAVAQRLDYDEFGRVLADTNPGFQPFGFAGGLYDPDTGLVRFGARDYDPATGRWTARDPRGFAGGDTNLYAYVGNDPINATDIRGEAGPLILLGLACVGACTAAVKAAGVALLVGTAALAAAAIDEITDQWDGDTIPDAVPGEITEPVPVPIPDEWDEVPTEVIPHPGCPPPGGGPRPEEPRKEPEKPRKEPEKPRKEPEQPRDDPTKKPHGKDLLEKIKKRPKFPDYIRRIGKWIETY